MIKKFSQFTILLFLLLFTSCEKNSDLETEKNFPVDIFFSGTINNEIFEFKSPSASPFSYSKGIAGFGESTKYTKDTVIIEYSRGFKDDKYDLYIKFSNVFIIDTVSSFYDVPDMKEYLFEIGSYPFQFQSIDNYGINKPPLLFTGVYIKLFDRLNHKFYESSIDYSYLENVAEYNDFMGKNFFNITKSTRLTSQPNTWFIEANFKCTLYKLGSGTEPFDMGKAFYISDGVLKGCF